MGCCLCSAFVLALYHSQAMLREPVLSRMNEIATQQDSWECCLGHQTVSWESETKNQRVAQKEELKEKKKLMGSVLGLPCEPGSHTEL